MIKRLSIASTVVLAAMLITGLAVATSDDSSSSTTTSTTLAQAAVGGSQTFEAGAAGQVTVNQSETSLSITDVAAGDGWGHEVEMATGREVEVKFVKGNERIDFQAELEDGSVKTRVRTRTLDDQPEEVRTLTSPSTEALTFDANGAGTVQLGAANGTLELISAAPNPGWMVIDIEIEDGREIEVEFGNGTTEIEFEAEMEDGMVKTEIETEDESDGTDDSSGRSADDEDDEDEDDHDEDEDEDED